MKQDIGNRGAEERLRALLDKEDIREVIGIRYARGLDWYDLDMLKSCFHDDAVLDYGYFKGNAHAWCDKRVTEGNPAELHRFHYCFPAQIELSGDTAKADSSSYSGYRFREGSEERYMLFGARYIDTVTRRDGVWRISARQVLVDLLLNEAAPAGPSGLQKGIPMLEHLRPSHPSYRRLWSPDNSKR